jgi:nucleoside-diphosphate-sugar epimerase
MEAPVERIKVRTSYNISAMSFSPAEIGEAVGQHVEGFRMDYAPDYRQTIADSWPRSIDDSVARADWGWKHEFDLPAMTADMISNLRKA